MTKNKDWTGNRTTTFATLGASSHSVHNREEHDYYATDPSVIDVLFKREDFSRDIWECACGEGHLSERMLFHHKPVKSSDLIDRGYGEGGVNFLTTESKWGGDIITNPPYKYAQEFVEKSLEIIDEGNKLALFLKLTFLEGQKRRELFNKYPPKTVYVFSARQKCAINGDFANTGSSAACYGWFVWEKGFKGDPIIKWL